MDNRGIFLAGTAIAFKSDALERRGLIHRGFFPIIPRPEVPSLKETALSGVSC